MDPHAAATITVAGFGSIAGAVWVLWRVAYWIGSQRIVNYHLERDE